jgi:lambda repressor-like predicted transcriptional regulator
MITFKQFKNILSLEEDFKTVKQKFISSGESEEEIDNYLNRFKILSANQRLSGDEKNIDMWGKKPFEDLKKFIIDTESTITKSGKKKDPGISIDITTPKQQAAGWRIIIPLNKQASCFEGRGTDWCVSKESQTYFEEYFIQKNITLIYCLDTNKKQKWAIVIYPDNIPTEFFDINDDSLTEEEFENKTGLNVKEIVGKITSAIKIKIESGRKDARTKYFATFTPIDAYNYAINSGESYKRTPELEDIIGRDPQMSYNYFAFVLRGIRFPKGEDAIATDAKLSLNYAKNIGKPFPKGEDAIATDPRMSYTYASHFMKPFPKGEDAIATNSDYAYLYATVVLKRRFPKGEDAIVKDGARSSYEYARQVLKKPFPKGEDVIATDPRISFEYARQVLKKPFPKGEDAIATDAKLSYQYASHFMKPFPKGEDVIATDPGLSFEYAVNVLKGPFPKGEKSINAMNAYFKNQYRELLNK